MSTGKGFVGYMDDLRTYNKVLADPEIREIFNSAKSVFAGRLDTNPTDRTMHVYKYQKQDHTLYQGQSQYNPIVERLGENVLKGIVAEGSNSTVQTAASELSDVAETMLGFRPSVNAESVSGPKVALDFEIIKSVCRAEYTHRKC